MANAQPGRFGVRDDFAGDESPIRLLIATGEGWRSWVAVEGELPEVRRWVIIGDFSPTDPSWLMLDATYECLMCPEMADVLVQVASDHLRVMAAVGEAVHDLRGLKLSLKTSESLIRNFGLSFGMESLDGAIRHLETIVSNLESTL